MEYLICRCSLIENLLDAVRVKDTDTPFQAILDDLFCLLTLFTLNSHTEYLCIDTGCTFKAVGKHDGRLCHFVDAVEEMDLVWFFGDEAVVRGDAMPQLHNSIAQSAVIISLVAEQSPRHLKRFVCQVKSSIRRILYLQTAELGSVKSVHVCFF